MGKAAGLTAFQMDGSLIWSRTRSWGGDYRHACDVHDIMYWLGATKVKEELTDRTLLINRQVLVDQLQGNGFPDDGQRHIARRTAFDYYLSFRDLGLRLSRPEKNKLFARCTQGHH